VQPLELRVYTYVTPIGLAVVLLRISLIPPVPDEVAGVIPAIMGRVQLNDVPEVLLEGK